MQWGIEDNVDKTKSTNNFLHPPKSFRNSLNLAKKKNFLFCCALSSTHNKKQKQV